MISASFHQQNMIQEEMKAADREEMKAADREDAIVSMVSYEFYELENAELEDAVAQTIAAFYNNTLSTLNTRVSEDNASRSNGINSNWKFKNPDKPQTFQHRVNELAAIRMERIAVAFANTTVMPASKRLAAAEKAYAESYKEACAKYDAGHKETA